MDPVQWHQQFVHCQKGKGRRQKKSGAFLAESCGQALKIKIEKKCIYK